MPPLPRLVATFQALDAILARSLGVVALRDLLTGSGLEALYLPSTGAATVTLANLPGEIHQAARTHLLTSAAPCAPSSSPPGATWCRSKQMMALA